MACERESSCAATASASRLACTAWLEWNWALDTEGTGVYCVGGGRRAVGEKRTASVYSPRTNSCAISILYSLSLLSGRGFGQIKQDA